MFLSAWCSRFSSFYLKYSLHGAAFSLLRSYSSAYLDTVECIKNMCTKPNNSEEKGAGGGILLYTQHGGGRPGVQVSVNVLDSAQISTHSKQ